MSKKSKKQETMKARARAASERKSAAARPTRAAHSNGRPGARGATRSRKPAGGPDARAVRIGAIAVAALALAGALYWAYATRGAVNAGIIAGLVALGLVAGLAIFTAVKTEAMVAALGRVAKR